MELDVTFPAEWKLATPTHINQAKEESPDEFYPHLFVLL